MSNPCFTVLGILVRPDLVQIDLSVEEVKRNAKKFSAALSVTNQPRAMEAFMRAHHVIAVAAALVIGLGAKQILFPPMKADADMRDVPSPSVNVLQMQRDMDTKSLPALKMNDKAFIFTEEVVTRSRVTDFEPDGFTILVITTCAKWTDLTACHWKTHWGMPRQPLYLRFCMSTMIALRIVALVSNVLFMAYGFVDHLYPVFMLHAILFPVNALRLVQFQHATQTRVQHVLDGRAPIFLTGDKTAHEAALTLSEQNIGALCCSPVVGSFVFFRNAIS